MRKLPVYLLLDVSGSMSGEPIQAVQNGVQLLQSTLRRDPYALESAFVSVITFESDVQQIVPLTEIAKFKAPTLTAGGGTSLGEALKVVTECAEREVSKTTAQQKGDWKPLVFIMTDGCPTDNVNDGLSKFKAYKWGTVVACAVEGADERVLTQITENVVKLASSDSNSFAAFFKWVSASISTSSKQIEAGTETNGLDELPPPPPEITLIQP